MEHPRWADAFAFAPFSLLSGRSQLNCHLGLARFQQLATTASTRFSVAKLRVLITKRGANRNVSPQSLVFTFGPQPHRKLAPRRRIPSRRRSYQTCNTKIINSTKQHRFSHCEIHYKVVTFVCKFKNLHSTLTYRDPNDWLWEDELKRKCSKLNTISAHPSLENTNQPDRLHCELKKSHACSCGHCLVMC